MPASPNTFVCLMVLIVLGGCCDCPIIHAPPYRIEVVEFQPPCPSDCTTLAEHDPETIWKLVTFPQAYAMTSNDTGLGVYPMAISHQSNYENPSRGVDCLLQFGLSFQPDEVVDFLGLSYRVKRNDWEELIGLPLQSTGLGHETPGWNIELVGEVPIIPARGEDLTEYLQQDFHIIGYPDEYIEPDPASCTGDLSSLSFDFRFIPLNPYGE
jgi:hypothetical protein